MGGFVEYTIEDVECDKIENQIPVSTVEKLMIIRVKKEKEELVSLENTINNIRKSMKDGKVSIKRSLFKIGELKNLEKFFKIDFIEDRALLTELGGIN